MKIEITEEEMKALLLDYCSNTISATTIIDKLNASEYDEGFIYETLGEFQRNWDALECDPEGFSKEQEKEADDLLADVTKDLARIVEMEYSIEIIKYGVFDYTQNWGCKNKEYGVFEKEEYAIQEVCRLAECVIEEYENMTDEEADEVRESARSGSFDYDGHYYKIEKVEVKQ
jgi:hypothetical protein